MPCQWLIGKKVYDPGKIRVFLEAIWSRMGKWQYDSLFAPCSSQIEDLTIRTQTLTKKLKKLKKDAAANTNTTSEAETFFRDLKKITAEYLSMYFNMRVKESENSKLGTQNSTTQ
jgi:hypothetical protein